MVINYLQCFYQVVFNRTLSIYKYVTGFPYETLNILEHGLIYSLKIERTFLFIFFLPTFLYVRRSHCPSLSYFHSLALSLFFIYLTYLFVIFLFLSVYLKLHCKCSTGVCVCFIETNLQDEKTQYFLEFCQTNI